MMKPFTCICLFASALSLLYLYEEKHAAQLVDRQIGDLIKQAAQVRERTGLLRAEYEMLNSPERLAQLASQHLSLQALSPSQFAKLSDLGSRLPAPVAQAPEPEAADEGPVASLPAATVAAPAIAAAAPVAPPARLAAAAAKPAAAMPDAVKTAAAAPPAPAPALRRAPKPHDAEPAGAITPPPAVYAPIMPAFASQKPPQPVRTPMLQRAIASMPETPYAPAPYVGSALGMAHSALAAPVPVANATDLGSSYGR